jgi:DNA-binding winged helix-turn-helix (wHTH) protein
MVTGFTDGYGRRLKHWLDAVGLTEDPFALYEAEREGARLTSFFVDRPYLYDVLGDSAIPQASFLMAGQGCGKTATRAMVAYECQYGKLKGRVLSVDYTDFGPLLSQVDHDLSRLHSRHHVRAVVRFALKAIAENIPPDNLEAISGVGRKLLMGFAQECPDVETQSKIAEVIGNERVELDWENLSSKEILQSLARLVTDMGPEAIYVLVDRVDETPETVNDAERAAALLKPLVADQPLLEMSNIAFKFFLPVEMGTILQEHVPIRKDRVFWHTIRWDRDALKELVQLRLCYYSHDRVTRFEDLCRSDARHAVVYKLVNACESSPRILLRLCRALIQHHIKHSSTTLLISRSDVTNTLHEFLHQLEIEREHISPRPDAGLPTHVEIAPPEKGLHLDRHGQIWIDGTEMEIPLSSLEMRLLETLYNRAPEIVSNEELIDAVWGIEPAAWDRDLQPYEAHDETNLRKLIARLRRRLATHLPGSGSRFVQNVRGRGYCLKAK